MISQTYKLESAGEGIMHLEALALLAAYGGWTRYEGEAATGGIQPNENLNIVKSWGNKAGLPREESDTEKQKRD